MDLNNAASILVIIISVLLGLVLILVIVGIIVLMRLIKSVKRIVAKAEDVVDSAEAVGQAFKNVRGPMGTLKLIKNIMDLVSESKKERK